MYYSLDRFEEELAVLEDDDEHTLTIPRILLPEGARPGDVLIRDGDRYSPAPDETADAGSRSAGCRTNCGGGEGQMRFDGLSGRRMEKGRGGSERYTFGRESPETGLLLGGILWPRSIWIM